MTLPGCPACDKIEEGLDKYNPYKLYKVNPIFDNDFSNFTDYSLEECFVNAVARQFGRSLVQNGFILRRFRDELI